MRALTVFMSEPLGPLTWLTLGGVLLFTGLHDVEGPAGVGLVALSALPFLAVLFGGAATRAVLHRGLDGALFSETGRSTRDAANAREV